MVYFESIPSRDRSLILAGGIAFFWLMETAFPLFKFSYKKWKHAAINVFFTFTTIIVNFALAFLLLQISRWTQESHWGLLTFIDSIPLILYALAGLMGLDLISAYFIHWLEHKVRFMWRFHLIHHTDVHVDTTTANRHHPGESIFRFVFTSLAVFILGAPIWLIMLYHYVLPQTDTNYGNIFSVWDRMFGTFSYMKQEDIIYGIDTHLDASEHSKISKMLKIPFEPYRKPVGGKFSSPEK